MSKRGRRCNRAIAGRQRIELGKGCGWVERVHGSQTMDAMVNREGEEKLPINMRRVTS